MTVSPTAAAHNATVTVQVHIEGLTPGVYVDTIRVKSDVSLTPPKQVIVTFTVTPTVGTPQIGLTSDSLLYIFKFSQLGSVFQTVTVFNVPGGCLDWQATANVPWLVPIPDTGTTVSGVQIRADAVGLPLGRSYGKVIFTSSTAVNSPVELPVTLWVWTFGDANGDGLISISDCIYIINYIFSGGPAPVPIFITGDVDCNREITVSDAVYLLNYVFSGGPPPCLF